MRELHLNERRNHGTSDFPVGYYFVTEQFPRYIMEQHWHIQYEIIHIIKGEFQLRVNNVLSVLHEGDYAFINSGVIHGGTPNNCTYECLVFNADFLRCREFKSDAFLRGLMHNKFMLPTLLSKSLLQSYPLLHSALEQAFNYMKNAHKFYELGVQAALYTLASEVANQHLFVETTDVQAEMDNIEPIKKTLETIQNNYADNITLDDLAGIAKLSGKYFCHIFQKLMGRTPIDYLNNYRIERAACLIEEGKYSLVQICYDCGFHDYSYFIRVFKKYKKVTPKKYKQSLEQSN